MPRIKDTTPTRARIYGAQVSISQRAIVLCGGREDLEVWLGLLLMCFLVRMTGSFYSGMKDSWSDACNLEGSRSS